MPKTSNKRFLTKKELIRNYLLTMLGITVSLFLLFYFTAPFSLPILFLYLAFNCAGLVIIMVDKKFASIEGMTRVPERFFFYISFAGASLGVLVGMYAFHHKTRKPSFNMIVMLAVLTHLLIVGLYFYLTNQV